MIKNIGDATDAAVGAKFVEWLKCEREYQAALKDMYCAELAHIGDSYNIDREFDDRDHPTDKRDTATLINRMQEALKKQQAVYDELYELADLNIAGGL